MDYLSESALSKRGTNRDALPFAAAVIATYNRRRDVEICIDALMRQTAPLQAIYVVDNASTDDTEAIIRSRFDAKVRYFKLPKNTGSAGGFRAGLELAYKDGFDWIWITDNDSLPLDDSLEELLAAAHENPGVMALAPMKLRTGDGEILNCDCIWDRTMDIVRNPTGREYQECGTIDVDWVANTGLLLNREMIAKAGNLRADLFAFGEDTEYCLRLRQHTRILVVPRSVVVHPNMGMGWPVPVKFLGKLYYTMRNEVYLGLRGLRPPRLTVSEAVWRWFRASVNILRKQDYPLHRLLVVAVANYHGLVGRLGVAPPLVDKWTLGNQSGGTQTKIR
jgi:GT2 family glycosyltransferase